MVWDGLQSKEKGLEILPTTRQVKVVRKNAADLHRALQFRGARNASLGRFGFL